MGKSGKRAEVIPSTTAADGFRALQVWSTGQNGSIMTFFELTEGDSVQDQGESVFQRIVVRWSVPH